MKTIDMQFMRYLNLFEKITKVRTKHCFFYNNQLVFAVEPKKVSKAIGENGKNVKKLSKILKKKIKIVPLPKNESEDEIEKFICKVIDPLQCKYVNVKKDKIVLKADRSNKARLIGRNKKRREELSEITDSLFDKEVEIA